VACGRRMARPAPGYSSLDHDERTLLTPDTLRFLRALCDQVKIDSPLTTPEARHNAIRLWAAVDELDEALANGSVEKPKGVI
jgi:hypothetical protein